MYEGDPAALTCVGSSLTHRLTYYNIATEIDDSNAQITANQPEIDESNAQITGDKS